MGPEALAQVLRPLSGLFDAAAFPALLRGLDVPDDAAVWKLDDERAFVLTSDFFPPLVDDPFEFGAIAAANALSDVWAMGARPLIALNLVGFPSDLDASILTEILRGGAETVREAGAIIGGGHSTVDAEPKYGLAVLGEVHPARMWANEGAAPGDRLLLSKPLGTGLITTAARKDAAEAEHLAGAVASMRRLHRGLVEALGDLTRHVHAATDVTGFGLLGHGLEMAEASRACLTFELGALPLLEGARRYAEEGRAPGGSRRNLQAVREKVVPADRLEDAVIAALLADPQTSGGLLLAVEEAGAEDILRRAADAGEPLWPVGRVEASPSGRIRLV